MLTIALIGPDGAGKTTVARKLEDELRPSVKYLYMGVSADSSNHMLPTTRLIRAVKRARGGTPDDRGPRDRGEVLGPGSATGMPAQRFSDPERLLSGQRIAWPKSGIASTSPGRTVSHGVIVIFDRHFFADYHAYDIEGGPVCR